MGDGEIQASFGSSLLNVIELLGVAEGEIDNITEAALRDIAEKVAEIMQRDWPRGERRTPSQMGVHSADLWEAKRLEKLTWVIRNDADYAAYVHNHPNQGGPPGLSDRVLPGLVAQAQEEPLRFISERVLQLLGGE